VSHPASVHRRPAPPAVSTTSPSPSPSPAPSYLRSAPRSSVICAHAASTTMDVHAAATTPLLPPAHPTRLFVLARQHLTHHDKLLGARHRRLALLLGRQLTHLRTPPHTHKGGDGSRHEMQNDSGRSSDRSLPLLPPAVCGGPQQRPSTAPPQLHGPPTSRSPPQRLTATTPTPPPATPTAPAAPPSPAPAWQPGGRGWGTGGMACVQTW